MYSCFADVREMPGFLFQVLVPFGPLVRVAFRALMGFVVVPRLIAMLPYVAAFGIGALVHVVSLASLGETCLWIRHIVYSFRVWVLRGVNPVCGRIAGTRTPVHPPIPRSDGRDGRIGNHV